MMPKTANRDKYAILTEEQVIRQLALEWVQSDLSLEDITFVDCINALTRLQTGTQDVYRTEVLFEIVFEQAQQLDKSSAWLLQELQFEAEALVASDRPQFVQLCLHKSYPVDDLALDTFNERLTRPVHREEIRLFP